MSFHLKGDWEISLGHATRTWKGCLLSMKNIAFLYKKLKHSRLYLSREAGNGMGGGEVLWGT